MQCHALKILRLSKKEKEKKANRYSIIKNKNKFLKDENFRS